MGLILGTFIISGFKVLRSEMMRSAYPSNSRMSMWHGCASRVLQMNGPDSIRYYKGGFPHLQARLMWPGAKTVASAPKVLSSFRRSAISAVKNGRLHVSRNTDPRYADWPPPIPIWSDDPDFPWTMGATFMLNPGQLNSPENPMTVDFLCWWILAADNQPFARLLDS